MDSTQPSRTTSQDWLPGFWYAFFKPSQAGAIPIQKWIQPFAFALLLYVAALLAGSFLEYQSPSIIEEIRQQNEVLLESYAQQGYTDEELAAQKERLSQSLVFTPELIALPAILQRAMYMLLSGLGIWALLRLLQPQVPSILEFASRVSFATSIISLGILVESTIHCVAGTQLVGLSIVQIVGPENTQLVPILEAIGLFPLWHSAIAGAICASSVRISVAKGVFVGLAVHFGLLAVMITLS